MLSYLFVVAGEIVTTFRQIQNLKSQKLDRLEKLSYAARSQHRFYSVNNYFKKLIIISYTEKYF